MTNGEKIKNARRKQGLTQQRLAEISGISLVSIRRYEQGTRNPSERALNKIAEALSLTKAELLMDEISPEDKALISALPKSFRMAYDSFLDEPKYTDVQLLNIWRYDLSADQRQRFIASDMKLHGKEASDLLPGYMETNFPSQSAEERSEILQALFRDYSVEGLKRRLEICDFEMRRWDKAARLTDDELEKSGVHFLRSPRYLPLSDSPGGQLSDEELAEMLGEDNDLVHGLRSPIKRNK